MDRSTRSSPLWRPPARSLPVSPFYSGAAVDRPRPERLSAAGGGPSHAVASRWVGGFVPRRGTRAAGARPRLEVRASRRSSRHVTASWRRSNRWRLLKPRPPTRSPSATTPWPSGPGSHASINYPGGDPLIEDLDWNRAVVLAATAMVLVAVSLRRSGRECRAVHGSARTPKSTSDKDLPKGAVGGYELEMGVHMQEGDPGLQGAGGNYKVHDGHYDPDPP